MAPRTRSAQSADLHRLGHVDRVEAVRLRMGEPQVEDRRAVPAAARHRVPVGDVPLGERAPEAARDAGDDDLHGA